MCARRQTGGRRTRWKIPEGGLGSLGEAFVARYQTAPAANLMEQQTQTEAEAPSTTITTAEPQSWQLRTHTHTHVQVHTHTFKE